MTDDNKPAKTPEEIMGMWADLRAELEQVDEDLHKHLAKGNTAAGRRFRAKMRDFKKLATAIMHEMVQLDKSRAESEKKEEEK